MSGKKIRCMWCNFEVEVLSKNRQYAFYVYCDNCGACGPTERTTDVAISEWERIAALKDMVENFTSANKQSTPCLLHDKGEMCTRTYSYRCKDLPCQV